jgi:hypothetical protein
MIPTPTLLWPSGRKWVDLEARCSKRSATGENHFSAKIDKLIRERAHKAVTVFASVEGPNRFDRVYSYILSGEKRPVECR